MTQELKGEEIPRCGFCGNHHLTSEHNTWQMPDGSHTHCVLEALEAWEKERQPTEVWTRVMGYYRPINHFNPGKQAEFEERVPFEEMKICQINKTD